MKTESLEKVPEVKRRIQAADRELHHLNEAQWSFSKHMLKFGVASWVVGMSSFFSAITVLNQSLIGTTIPMWAPLLISALAAPVALTAMLVRKFAVRIKKLEVLRRKLLADYEKAKLARVGEMIIAR